MVAALNNLSLQIKNHVEATEKKFGEFGEAISVLNQRGSFRGSSSYSGRSRGTFNRGTYNRRGYQAQYRGRGRGNNNNSNNNTGNRTPIRCYKCNELNHYAKDCQSTGSGNL